MKFVSIALIILVSFVGIALLYFGFTSIKQIESNLTNATTTQGIVSGLDLRIGGSGSLGSGKRRGIISTPIIKFKTNNGVEIEFKTYDNSLIAMYKIGQTVPVIYDPSNPNNAFVNTVIGKYQGPILILVAGIMTMVLAVVAAYRLVKWGKV